MGHGPARRRGWSYVQVRICPYVQGRICSYVLVVPVSRIWLGTRADFSGDHTHPGRYRAGCILLGRDLLGRIQLGQVLLGKVLLGRVMLGCTLFARYLFG